MPRTNNVGFFLAASAFILLVGCQGGGRTVTKAKICTSAIDPLNVEKMGKNINKKVSLDPSKKIGEQVDQKTFKFQNAQIYVYDKTQNSKLYLSYMKSGSNYTEKVECIGSTLREDMKPILLEIPFISSLTVKPDETLIKSRTFSLSIDPDPVKKWINFKFGTEEVENPEKTSPFDFYNEYVNNSHFFLSTKAANTFQLASVIETYSPAALSIENKPQPDLEIRLLVTYTAE